MLKIRKTATDYETRFESHLCEEQEVGEVHDEGDADVVYAHAAGGVRRQDSAGEGISLYSFFYYKKTHSPTRAIPSVGNAVLYA